METALLALMSSEPHIGAGEFRFFHNGERAKLLELVRSVNPQNMAEIGINIGRTAQFMLANVPSIKRYFGIDLLPMSKPTLGIQWREVPQHAGHLVQADCRVSLHVTSRGSFDLTPDHFHKMIDVIFIDGDHSKKAVRHDSELARAWVRPGGIIIWHDYRNTAVQVTAVIDDYIDEGHPIHVVPGTWLAYERH